jgi:hypothetical protein
MFKKSDFSEIFGNFRKFSDFSIIFGFFSDFEEKFIKNHGSLVKKFLARQNFHESNVFQRSFP